ncbi:hypothetical protein CKAN_01671200 [Cinnamomum micranthum f. kanehirae]|uniref:Uncharacterized protein n=1 Tax=Cinnamomum micranthum f. kanehirae TaxID=337451 RepID=A0A3S3QPT9_9MAGN|nr:hypothetical protein CKAN_01671200 [Cinnamomum micranthum f. kanehirae]
MSRLQCHCCGRQMVLSRRGEEVVGVSTDKEVDGDQNGVVGVEGNGVYMGFWVVGTVGVWEVGDGCNFSVVEGGGYRCVWEVVDASKEYEVVDASKEYEVVEGGGYRCVWEVVDASKEYEVVEGGAYRCVWDQVVDASKEYEVVEGGVYRCVWEVVDASKEYEVVEGDAYRCVWEVVDASKEYEVGFSRVDGHDLVEWGGECGVEDSGGDGGGENDEVVEVAYGGKEEVGFLHRRKRQQLKGEHGTGAKQRNPCCSLLY